MPFGIRYREYRKLGWRAKRELIRQYRKDNAEEIKRRKEEGRKDTAAVGLTAVIASFPFPINLVLAVTVGLVYALAVFTWRGLAYAWRNI